MWPFTSQKLISKQDSNLVIDLKLVFHHLYYYKLISRLFTKKKNILQTILEPSSDTPEKFALFKKYQEDIHHDLRNSPSSFQRFLVDSPLMVIITMDSFKLRPCQFLTFKVVQAEPIPYDSPPPSHLPLEYGSYHQLYRLDGELIAMSVIDILPNCVSSVYFMYDKKWERFSLGKVSRIRYWIGNLD